ncbi:hypothetical protein K488DRAFT_56524, partial [Vararia minispora EC-137]
MSQDPEGCMSGTRVALLQELHDWSVDDTAPSIFWLDGMAGTGKSAVARSFCCSLRDNQLLGGSFFCSRVGKADRHDVKHILPTLALSLARHSPSYAKTLLTVLERENISTHSNLDVQVSFLLEEPLRTVHDEARMPRTLVLVVDALDECEDEELTYSFLQKLLDAVRRLPIKLFLTSRPEPHIRAQLLSNQNPYRRVVRLHDIAESIVSGDISRYLTTRLRGVRAK